MIETINNKNITCFYKYRPLADDTGDAVNPYTLKMLKEGELYFAKPSSFNDPFDSQITYDTDLKTSDIKALCKRMNASRENTDRIISCFKYNPSKIIKLFQQKQADYLRLYCLSTNEKNILMWSHYANNHTGICVGIKTYFLDQDSGNHPNIKIRNGYVKPNFFFQNAPNILTPIKVKYTDSIPAKYNIGQQNRDALEQVMLHKATDWQYEEEYRIVLWEDVIQQNPICIEVSEITEIIFGLRASDKLIKEVKGVISNYPNNGANTKLYKCVQVPNKYALEKTEIS
ncbi:MAG: DUF2971 domain-containing protein [Elusimicrobiota bacterium]|jgi:hypothetical protein|nr:DUF2971 domain-containing protein [Elusimicrobiota bacterium]